MRTPEILIKKISTKKPVPVSVPAPISTAHVVQEPTDGTIEINTDLPPRLRKKRHEFYDFLASIGAKEMGVNQNGRNRVATFLREYMDLRCVTLKAELTRACKTNEGRSMARREKLKRGEERRLSRLDTVSTGRVE